MADSLIVPPQKKSNAGRKSLYKPSVVNKIIESLKKGLNQQDSAIIGGISHETYYQWIKLYPEFSDAVKKAMVFNKEARIERISNHGRTNWQADAWYLERMYPQEFALKTVTEHTGKVDNQITITIVPDIPHGISDKQLKQIESSYVEGQVMDSPQVDSKQDKEEEGSRDIVGDEGLRVAVPSPTTTQKPQESPQGPIQAPIRGSEGDGLEGVKPIVSYSHEEDEDDLEPKGIEKDGL